MLEKLEVGTVKKIMNGDGEPIQVKLTKVERHHVRYKQRRSNKGRWSTKESDISRVAFWRAARAASALAV